MLIALDDAKELQLIPKYQIRFHIAHCYDGAKDFKRATEEYRRLLFDHERLEFQLPVALLAVVHRQLGILITSKYFLFILIYYYIKVLLSIVYI